MTLRDNADTYREYCKQSARRFRTNNPEYTKEYLKKQYWKDPEKARQQAKDWRDKNPYRYKQIKMLDTAKARARDQNIPFDLTLEDIVIPEYCPILPWIKLRLERHTGPSNNYSPSLDKIVPEKGYVKGNVQVISKRANSLKNNATIQELKAIAKWIDTL